MTYKEFVNKIEYLHNKGELWDSLTSGVSHADSHVGQSIEEELHAIICKGKEGHSSFENASIANKAIYGLLTDDKNTYKLWNFLNNADVGEKYKINFTEGDAIGTGIAQDYSGNLEARRSRNIRAIFYKSADKKDTLGLNLDTCFPLITAERGQKIDKNLAPTLERSGLLKGMSAEEQTYWWTAANSAINLELDFDGKTFTAEGIERTSSEINGRKIRKDVTIKMTISPDACDIDTDDDRSYNLLNEDDFGRFCRDFPQRSEEFATAFNFHEEKYFEHAVGQSH